MEYSRDVTTIHLLLARDLVANPRRVTDRCIDTVTISGRVMSREVARELDLSVLADSVDGLMDLGFVVLPLVKRDKDTLIDNLSIDIDGSDSSSHVLPRHRCQLIARLIIQMEWDALRRKSPVPLPASALGWFLLVPQLSIQEGRRCFSRGLAEMQSQVPLIPAKSLDHFSAWIKFFTINHIIWVETQAPTRGGRIKVVYRHDMQYFRDRHADSLRPRGAMRIAASSLRGSKSYHFRMNAAPGYFVRSQRIEGTSDIGSTQVVTAGGPEKPYVHLYAGEDVPRSGLRAAWASIRFWEAPPWSSTDAAVIGLASICMIGAVLAAAVVPGAKVSPAAAALTLSLPAAAAAWIGAPTSRDVLLSLPRLSRLLLVFIGLTSIVSAVYVSAFTKNIQRHADWNLCQALSNGYLFPLFLLLILQVTLVAAALRRTQILRRGSRLLRSGFDHSNMYA